MEMIIFMVMNLTINYMEGMVTILSKEAKVMIL